MKTAWNKGKKLLPFSKKHKSRQSKALKKLWASGHFDNLRDSFKQGLFKGHKHTPETKLKMSLAKLGRKLPPFSKEHKRRLSEAKKGKIYTTDHKKKARARSYLNIAILRGKIFKKPCKICGNKKADAHHEDYNYPLKVEWLCKKHHKSLKHKKYAL